jgi:Xaa-Pro aminopeptidase
MHEARLQLVRDRLSAEGLDALLVTSLPNIYYLSGFTGSTAVVAVTHGHAWFITDFRYHEQVAQQVPAAYTLVDNTGRKLMQDVLPGLSDSANMKRVGFESQHVVHAVFTKLSEMNGMGFVPTEGWIEDLRLIKDEQEIERLRAAVRLNERVFSELLELIGPQTTEADLAAEIHFRALKYGAQGYSFDPIVASGAHAAKPHAGFTAERLVPGQPLTIDMGLKLDGYCSDMTRTVFIKDCTPRWKKIYNLVREAKDRAFAQIRPGRVGREIDAVARELINGAGLGHGVGVEVHEQPTLSSVGERELRPGMVVTDEPGIYLAGEGGVRIEDMVVVREDGAENLNELDTELRVVG